MRELRDSRSLRTEADAVIAEGAAHGVRDPDGVPARLDRLVTRAVEGSTLTVFGVDTDLRYAWLVNVLPPWSEEMLLGRNDVEALGEANGRPIMESKRRVLETGRAETIEVDVRSDHQHLWYEVAIKRDVDAGGAPFLLCTALDISEKKRREIMLHALLREVSHRSRNLLSMVLSIASQTSRKSFDKHTFLARFSGRIQSIARSQDAITSSDWRGAALSELLASQVLSASPDRAGAISLEGRDLQLTPNAALHVGLALHELTTNALAHGVLMGNQGRIEIAVEAPGPEARGPAAIIWRERGKSVRDATPTEDSFGMTTLKRIVPSAVGGEGRLEFLEDGLGYRLTLDPGEYDPLPAPLSAAVPA